MTHKDNQPGATAPTKELEMDDKDYQDTLWVTAIVSLLVGVAAGACLFYGLSGGI